MTNASPCKCRIAQRGVSTARTDSIASGPIAWSSNANLGNLRCSDARDTAANFLVSLNQFQHRPTGANCVFGGAVTAEPSAVAWLGRVTTQGNGLPGLPNATVANQQILIDTSATGFNRVQITVCWQAPNDQAMRHHTLVTYINGLAPPT